MFGVEPADEDVDGHCATHQVLRIRPLVLLRGRVLQALGHAHSHRLRCYIYLFKSRHFILFVIDRSSLKLA